MHYFMVVFMKNPFFSLFVLLFALFLPLTLRSFWKLNECVFFSQVKVVSPKHRLIKVDSQEFGRCKVPLSPVTVQEEPVRTVCVGALLDFP